MELIVILVVVGILLAATAGFLYIQRRPTDDLRLPARTAAPPAAAPRTLGDRLGKTRHAVGDRISGLLKRGRLDDEFWSDLEETLIAGDVGVATASAVVGRVRDARPADTDAAHSALRIELEGLFGGRDRSIMADGDPAVIVVVGVNGTGKTTSIAKLGHRLIHESNRVVLGAADTFRAGAAEQLETWAGRIGAEFVGGEANSDPAAVAYRALQHGKEIEADVVIIDTAGRLHSNRNLMEELAKIVRVLTREAGQIHETLLVLDATTGQNAIAQANTFTEVVGVSGIVLTKLDGTARGGVVVAVEQELDIPVKLVGVGESMEDLMTFEPGSFVAALLGDEG